MFRLRQLLLLIPLLTLAAIPAANGMYDPHLGRFCSRDPIGFEGSLGQYCYVASTPTNAIDPSGLKPSWCFYLESWIKGQLTNPTEQAFWQHFVGGSGSKATFDQKSTFSIVKDCQNLKVELASLRRACSEGNRWEETTTSVQCGTSKLPLAIGNYTAQLTHSCVCGCFEYSINFSDVYDFDPKFFKSHRGLVNELKTIGVSLAQAISGCGWKDYPISGTPFGNSGCG